MDAFDGIQVFLAQPLPQPVREAGYESLALAWLARVPQPKRDWLSD